MLEIGEHKLNGSAHSPVYKPASYVSSIQKVKMSSKSYDQDNSNSTNQFYYGVYHPSDSPTEQKEYHVYTDRSEVLRFLKQNRRARFKAFTSEVDAIYFTQYGCTLLSQSPINASQSHSITCVQEKSVFKAPKPQEMVKFRKAIEVSDLSLVKKLVEENPRYLVSSGDTPSILQEGPRYNALHVAARCNEPDIASYILELISTSNLTDRLYGYDTKDGELDQRGKVLLDLFLNTPDKSLNETPLHFASKFGSLSVVKLLLFYSECDRNRRNKYGLTPLDVVCSRASGTLLDNKEEIIKHLKHSYYIPVLRSRDNTTQPIIGDPITVSNNLDVSSVIKETVLSPRTEIQALAGPMTEEEAHSFRKMWRSPRSCSSPLSPKVTSPQAPLSIGSHLRPSLYDFDKGLERIGRQLASQFEVKWCEYWAFLDAFVDLGSTEGLDMLETYLKEKFQHEIKNGPTINSRWSSEDGANCENHSKTDKARRTNICDNNNLPIKCFLTFLEMVARRLSNSLSRNISVYHDISHLETFLTNSSQDKRFDCIDLNKAHYLLAQYIEVNLKNVADKAELISRLKNFPESHILPEIFDENRDIVRRAAMCIISYVIHFLSPQEMIPENQFKSSVKQSKCDCKLMRDKRRRFRDRFAARRKLQFIDELENSETNFAAISEDSFLPHSNRNSDRFSAHKILEFSDEYETSITNPPTMSDEDFSPEINNIIDRFSSLKIHEDEFEHSLTNSSTILEDNNLDRIPSVNTEINIESGDEFITPPESPCSFDDEFTEFDPTISDTFLGGDKPTKLDDAVLHVIKNINVTCEQYPFIYFWMQACEERAKAISKERWPTANMKMQTTPTQRTLAWEFLSPSWK